MSTLVQLPVELFLKVISLLSAEDLFHLFRVNEFLKYITDNGIIFNVVTASRLSCMNDHEILMGLKRDTSGIPNVKFSYLDVLMENPPNANEVIIILLGLHQQSTMNDSQRNQRIIDFLKDYLSYVWFGDTESDVGRDHDQRVETAYNRTISQFLSNGCNIFMNSTLPLYLKDITFNPLLLGTRDVPSIEIAHVGHNEWYGASNRRTAPKPSLLTLYKGMAFDNFHGVKAMRLKVRDVSTLNDYIFEGYESLSELYVELPGSIDYRTDQLGLNKSLSGVIFSRGLTTLEVRNLTKFYDIELVNLKKLTVVGNCDGTIVGKIFIPVIDELTFIADYGPMEIFEINTGTPDNIVKLAEFYTQYDESKKWKVKGCGWILEKTMKLDLTNATDVLAQVYNSGSYKCDIKIEFLTIDLSDLGSFYNPGIEEMIFPHLKELFFSRDGESSVDTFPHIKAPILESLIIHADGTRIQPGSEMFEFEVEDALAERYRSIKSLSLTLCSRNFYNAGTLKKAFSDWRVLPNLESLTLDGFSLCQFGEFITIAPNLRHLSLIYCLGKEVYPKRQLLLTALEPSQGTIRLSTLLIKQSHFQHFEPLIIRTSHPTVIDKLEVDWDEYDSPGYIQSDAKVCSVKLKDDDLYRPAENNSLPQMLTMRTLM